MKTSMKYLVRAWKKETKSLGWDKSFPTKKEWKDFCRGNAIVSVECIGCDISSQDEADDFVSVELSYWD